MPADWEAAEDDLLDAGGRIVSAFEKWFRDEAFRPKHKKLHVDDFMRMAWDAALEAAAKLCREQSRAWHDVAMPAQGGGACSCVERILAFKTKDEPEDKP